MKILKSTIKKVLRRLGYKITKAKPGKEKRSKLNTMESGLLNLKNLGICPNNILDIGAAKGNWTKLAMQHWPKVNYDLIEPLVEQEESLAKLKNIYSNIEYHLAVAGESRGNVSYSVSNDLDGSGIYGGATGKIRKVPVTTVDEVCKGKQGPFIIKLDTHGYEVPILQGAKETLKKTEALIIEVYGFYVSPTAKLFHELSVFLYELDFRLVDIVDVMRRPKDQAFWQADAFYLRKDHPVFEENSYSSKNLNEE